MKQPLDCFLFLLLVYTLSNMALVNLACPDIALRPSFGALRRVLLVGACLGMRFAVRFVCFFFFLLRILFYLTSNCTKKYACGLDSVLCR